MKINLSKKEKIAIMGSGIFTISGLLMVWWSKRKEAEVPIVTTTTNAAGMAPAGGVVEIAPVQQQPVQIQPAQPAEMTSSVEEVLPTSIVVQDVNDPVIQEKSKIALSFLDPQLPPYEECILKQAEIHLSNGDVLYGFVMDLDNMTLGVNMQEDVMGQYKIIDYAIYGKGTTESMPAPIPQPEEIVEPETVPIVEPEPEPAPPPPPPPAKSNIVGIGVVMGQIG